MKKFLALILSLVMLLALTACGGSSPESVLEEYMAASYEGDVQVFYDSLINPYSIKNDVDAGLFADEAAAEDAYIKLFESNLARTQAFYGDDAKLTSFEVKSSTYYDKAHVAKIANYANEQCNIPKDAITEVCIIEYSFSVESSKKSEDFKDLTAAMVKIDDNWYYGIDGGLSLSKGINVNDIESLLK